MHAVGFVWWLAQWPLILLGMSMFAGMANTVNDGCAAGKNKAPLRGLCHTVPQHLQLMALDDVDRLSLAERFGLSPYGMGVRWHSDFVDVVF